MSELIKTEISEKSDPIVAPIKNDRATSYQTIEYLIYFFFGALEILLAFRLILRLMGANTFNAFVGLVYGITGVFILPFQGIFRQATTIGIETTAVLESSTLIAILVYGIVAIGVVKLLRIVSGKKQQA